MSIEVVLIPVAIAAVGAWRVSRPEPGVSARTVCRVATRMRDADLLRTALGDTGAAVLAAEDARIVADWSGVRATFGRGDDGIWSAHLEGELDESRAVDIVTAVDQAYGRRVQQAVVARLLERAPTAGLSVESRSVGEDDSVTVVLGVPVGA